ncbi:hypothetical protein FQR65_LT20636 [Abscondita terminalis]|nr:hypothetical protein FQR65_LT20636 [Abscondita terminalis]
MACAMAWIWAGVVPQQPPTRLSRPAWANSRRAGIGVGADVTIGHVGQGFHMLAQIACAQGTVQTDGERLAVRHRGIEGFSSLPRQRAARGIGDGAGNHDRQACATLIKRFLDGKQGGLGVECVKDGFHHQHVGTTVNQAFDGLPVGDAQFVETGVAKPRIVHVRADRGSAAGRSQYANDKAWLLWSLRLHGVAAGAGHLGTGMVEFVDQMLQVVIGLADGGGIEGVGFNQIGPGLEVGRMHPGDDLGPGQQQQVVVALEIMAAMRAVSSECLLAVEAVGKALAAIVFFLQAMALNHRAHGTVDNQNAVCQRIQQLLHALRV